MSGLESIQFENNQNLNEQAPKSAPAPITPSWRVSRVIEGDAEGTMLFQNALVLVENEEYQLAQEVLRALIQRNPHSVQVIYWLVQCEVYNSNFAEAEKMARELVKLSPDFFSYYLLAETLYSQAADEEALDFYFRSLKAAQYDEDVLFNVYKNIGNILVRSRDFEGANEYYCKAHALQPESDVLAVNLGTLEIQQGNMDRALEMYRAALNFNIENDRAWVGLALIHYQFSDKELAWANLNRALDINVRNKTALELIASWAESPAQNIIAEHRLKNYMGVEGMDSEMSFLLAKVFYKNGRVSEALIEIERTLVLRPDWQELAKFKNELLSLAEVRA